MLFLEEKKGLDTFPSLQSVTYQLLPSTTRRGACRAGRAEVAARCPFFFSPSEALALSNTHVCLVAEALCAQLRGGRDDMRVRRASLWGHHFPISTQAQGSASQPPPSPRPLHHHHLHLPIHPTLGSFSRKSIPPPAPRRHTHCPRGYKHFIEHVAAPRYSKPFPALPLARGL